MRRKLLFSLIGIMVVAYGALMATIITDSKPALGLDLQGGISVTQRAVSGATCSDASMQLAVEKIRERVDSLGVSEPEILCQGDTIVVNLPGVKNQQQAVDLVQVTGLVYLRPVLQACQVLNIPDPSASTTTAAGGSTTSVAGSSTTTGATNAPTTTAAGGPSRPLSSGNTSTTLPASTTTAAGSTTTTGPTGSTTSTNNSVNFVNEKNNIWLFLHFSH